MEKISIDKFKVSFIGDIRVLEQHSYDIKKKDLLISDKYQIDFFSVENTSGFEKGDIIIILSSTDLEKDVCLCQYCRKITDNPIIIVGENCENYITSMLYAGADDYLKLPFSKKILDTLIFIHIRRELRRREK